MQLLLKWEFSQKAQVKKINCKKWKKNCVTNRLLSIIYLDCMLMTFSIDRMSSNVWISRSVSCRRPIKGAAERPIKSSDLLWNRQSFTVTPTVTRTTSSSSSYSESRLVNRVSSLQHTSSPPVASSPSKPLAGGSTTSVWKKLLLVAVVASFLFLVYQAMESNSASPFGQVPTSE